MSQMVAMVVSNLFIGFYLVLLLLLRPTIFIEIIQRIGCMEEKVDGTITQKGGCGGFGKGNFSELFKSIEEYEKTLDGSLRV